MLYLSILLEKQNESAMIYSCTSSNFGSLYTLQVGHCHLVPQPLENPIFRASMDTPLVHTNRNMHAHAHTNTPQTEICIFFLKKIFKNALDFSQRKIFSLRFRYLYFYIWKNNLHICRLEESVLARYNSCKIDFINAV